MSINETNERRFRARPKKMATINVQHWEDIYIAKREGWKSEDPQGFGSSATAATQALLAEEAAYYDE